MTGEGWAQKEGEPVVYTNPSDIVYFAPGEKHWHGAVPDSFMVHIAVNPAINSNGGTTWMAPVSDKEYADS
ncbi:MAG TPA: cupin domain-containing protein [Rubrobacteraceae bacterium]|nr:cupin domain-containing protein [Rubrobacteraceae bacterium]